MKTIHITSQDDLPDVAEAVIEALGRRTVVAFRGEMGAGKNDADPRNRRAAGRDGHRNQPHVRHRQPVQGQGRPPHPPFRLLPHQRRPRSLRLRLRRVFLFGRPLSGRMAREDRAAPARERDDGAHHRRQRHGTHVRNRLKPGQNAPRHYDHGRRFPHRILHRMP